MNKSPRSVRVPASPTTRRPVLQAVSLGARDLLRAGDRALWMDGELATARDHFDAAYRAAEQTGDREAMADAVIGLGGLWVHEHRDVRIVTLLHDRLRRALADADPGSPLGIRLRARYAAERDYRLGTYGGVLAVVDEARAAGDAVALAEATSLAQHCVLGPDHAALRRTLSRQMLTAAVATRRRSDLLVGLLWRVVGGFLDADPLAERGLADLRGHLADRDHPAVSFVVRAIEVMLCLRAGRFAESRTLAAACAERGAAAGDADADGWYGAHLVTIAWYEGRLPELLPTLRELAVSPSLSAVDNSFAAALAVASALAGQHREATAALARLRGADLAGLPRSSSWLVTIYGLVEAAYLVGDGALAAEAYNLLLPHADRPMLASLGVACFGSVRHALGMASLTAGETDRAVGHLRAAVQDNLRLGNLPAATVSRARLGQALLLRCGPDDRVEARRQLDLATADAAELGVALPAAARSNPQTGGGTAGGRAVVRRRGRGWEFGLGPRVAAVDDSVGARYLAVLVANPGHEIPAVELAAGLVPAPVAGATSAGQPILDEAAKRSYRRRLDELAAEIDEADAAGAADRAERARSERQWLIDELAAQTGLGGRDRGFAGNAERARISVGKAIRRALDRIAAADPVVGEELRTAVRTGVRCSYHPA